MARLIYFSITSLDGYISDREGKFDWAEPDEEVHTFVNDLERPIGTYLLGRRMYEVMRYWETADQEPGQPAYALDYAQVWQAADKIVYSTTLDAVDTARTRLEQDFDPAAVEVLKREAHADLGIGGPDLAARALNAGLVDELRLILFPVVVGGGHAALPDGLALRLDLENERRFGNGAVYLSYRVSGW